MSPVLLAIYGVCSRCVPANDVMHQGLSSFPADMREMAQMALSTMREVEESGGREV